MTTLVLAAGNHSVNSIYNSQMLPVRGKPALAWVIEESYQKEDVFVVLNKANIQTQKYLAQRYPNVKQILVDVDEENKRYGTYSILTSLASGLEKIPTQTSLLKLVLGDTLCRGYETYDKDAVVVSDDFLSSERWCLVDKDKEGNVHHFYDKQANLDIADKYALTGLYQFTNIPLLKKLNLEVIQAGKRQISNVLDCYNQQVPLKTIKTALWFDFGHKAGIIKAQNHFFNSRDFNSLYADPIAGTITKVSPKRQKLADEYAWYKNLPLKLQVLAPRPVEFKENMDNAVLTMEMYGYPALSELFILGNLSIEEWELIIERLFQVHQLFEEYTAEMNQENFYDLYLHKTWQRLKELQEQNPYWKKLWEYETIVLNGKTYKNIRFFETQLNDAIEHLVKTVKPTVMHGDYCFSNILFDTNSFLCKLIDPRGRMHEQTIYGDPRYDIAKLRHSVVGAYDYAVHGLFRLNEEKNSFTVSDNYPTFQERLTAYFDKMTVQFGYELDEIKLIEALLFTSMIPLHKDSMERQKLFYLKAVRKINELFERK